MMDQYEDFVVDGKLLATRHKSSGSILWYVLPNDELRAALEATLGPAKPKARTREGVCRRRSPA
jgi:hypothetical protein